jgi:hypothetical protein
MHGGRWRPPSPRAARPPPLPPPSTASSGGLAPPPRPPSPGLLDRTFGPDKGPFVRFTALVMIGINYLLLIIGFVAAVYGLRLGSQEYAQMEFLRGELAGNVTLAADLYLSVKQSSGLTQGLVVNGALAIVIATVGMCGSVRGSRKCLYCYAVSSMMMLVAQSILIALLNNSVASLDTTVKELIRDSDAAKDLVRQNGAQALYVGLFAFTIEVIGFAGSLLARAALNQSKFEEDFQSGVYDDDLASFRLSELHPQLREDGVIDGPAAWLQRSMSMRAPLSEGLKGERAGSNQ